MHFVKEGQIIQLVGEPKPSPDEASLHQFRRLVHTHSLDSFFALYIVPSTPTPSMPLEPDPKITQLLTKYAPLFTTPHTLPPERPTDHHIPLLTGTTPVNVHPYRYPHFQKRETQIREMLT